MYCAAIFINSQTRLTSLGSNRCPLQDRIRLGLLVLKARRCADWYKIESMTARQWLIKLAGKKVYEIVWKPLINGKFGQYASDVSAVYMWNKLKLRGGSHGKDSRESLAYFKGSFAALTDELVKSIRKHGSKVLTNKCADGIIIEDNRVKAVNCKGEIFRADHVLLTPALSIENLWLSTMAQIYPQDRGTNYAVKAGRQVIEMIYKK
jgi:protoporphyrinogen oxidase